MDMFYFFKNGLTVFAIFSICFLNAQEVSRMNTSPKIDSLLNALPSESDSVKADMLNLICKQYTGIGVYSKAIEYAELAEKMSVDLKYQKGVATAYNNIGNVYLNQGNYEKALSNYLKALKIREETNEKVGLAITYNNIGIIYFVQANYKLALEYAFKALKIRQELADGPGLVMSYNNIGLIYYNLNDYEKALESYLKCLELNEKTGDKYSMSVSYNNIGNVYKLKKEYAKALDNQLKGLKISKEIADTQTIAFSYLSIGSLYTYLGKFKESENYLNKALNIDNAFGNKDAVKEEYLALSYLFEKKNDYEQAFKFHKLYSDVKDTLLNEESSKQITEMNTKYESEKKEKDIQLLTKNKELQQAEIGRQKLIRNGFVGGLAIALLLAFVLLNRFRVTRKQKGIIEYQNSQIVESINYSKRIQDSLLPSIESMQQAIPSLFVFYEPKNIVSGDFYFFKEFENYILLACVDCTGHGVPGGFMSTLGSLLLDKIANDENLKPSEILIKLSDEIVRVLHQQDGGEIQDGMDLSVCLINRHNHQIEFSGARNGIIVVTNNEAKRYKASPLPVGGNYMKKGAPLERNFQTQTISLNANDWVYMYTDGFIEQMGGKENIPMNYEQFEKQLVTVSKEQTTEEKINLLNTKLIDWKGGNERTDDTLIIGFQIVST
jgi:tetratricopeptide (TPR) repeat protein